MSSYGVMLLLTSLLGVGLAFQVLSWLWLVNWRWGLVAGAIIITLLVAALGWQRKLKKHRFKG